MTLQNRVTPFGDIVAVLDRGTLMGNRGILHNNAKKLVRTHASRRDWMTCALSFKGWKQELMRPGSYTQLFFLDEATALAAGHRPCSTCRRAASNAFKTAWLAAGLAPPDQKLSVAAIDTVMHQDRIDRSGRKRTYTARSSDLPAGTMIALHREPEAAWLVFNDHLVRWTAAGYSEVRSTSNEIVDVLTPASTVRVLAAGYPVDTHGSAAIAFES